MALAVHHPGLYWVQSDADIYRAAARALWHPDGRLYSDHFGKVQYPFTYPPFAAVLFSCFGFVPFLSWQIALAAAGLAAIAYSIRRSFRLGATSVSVAKVLVLIAVCLWLEPVDLTLHFGQINLILLALVLGDLAVADDRRYKGVGTGLAAAIKLTPLIFVLYLWLTGRRRAALTALTAFGAASVLALALRPRDSLKYWGGQVVRPDSPQNSVNQSLNGLLRRLMGEGAGTVAVWLVASVLVAVVGLGAAVLAARGGDELLGVTCCATVGLLISPISWTHHYVWVVPVLVLFVRGLDGRSLAGVAALVLVFAWWPLPVGANGGLASWWHPSGLLRITAHNDGRESHWGFGQFLAGNLYVWAALAYLGYALSLVRGHRPSTLTAPRSSTSVSS